MEENSDSLSVSSSHINAEFQHNTQEILENTDDSCQVTPSDAKLLKDMDNQIQIVNQIQLKLLTEQKTLIMLLKEFRTRKTSSYSISRSRFN